MFRRLVSWIVDPVHFLALRLLADFGGGAYYLAVVWTPLGLATGLWFVFVGLLTVASYRKTRSLEAAVRERDALRRRVVVLEREVRKRSF